MLWIYKARLGPFPPPWEIPKSTGHLQDGVWSRTPVKETWGQQHHGQLPHQPRDQAPGAAWDCDSGTQP